MRGEELVIVIVMDMLYLSTIQSELAKHQNLHNKDMTLPVSEIYNKHHSVDFMFCKIIRKRSESFESFKN